MLDARAYRISAASTRFQKAQFFSIFTVVNLSVHQWQGGLLSIDTDTKQIVPCCQEICHSSWDVNVKILQHSIPPSFTYVHANPGMYVFKVGPNAPERLPWKD